MQSLTHEFILLKVNAGWFCEARPRYSYPTSWQEDSLYLWDKWFLGTDQNAWVSIKMLKHIFSFSVYLQLNNCSPLILCQLWLKSDGRGCTLHLPVALLTILVFVRAVFMCLVYCLRCTWVVEYFLMSIYEAFLIYLPSLHSRPLQK